MDSPSSWESTPPGEARAVPLSRIQALISLLGDEDQKIVDVAWRELENIGSAALPFLREASRESRDERVKVQSQRFLVEWDRREVFREWVRFCRESRPDLEKGGFLIARSEEPHCKVETYVGHLDDYADVMRRRLATTTSVDDAVKKVGRFLFEELGYRGNSNDYYHADNSYLHRMFDLKMGLPISLATLFLLVSRRLELPVVGLSMPRHFLLKYRGSVGELFIDAFHGGRILNLRECTRFMAMVGVQLKDEHLQPVSDKEILVRMLNNLFRVYWNGGDKRRSSRVAAMLKLLA